MASNKQSNAQALASINPQAMTATTNGSWVQVDVGSTVWFMVVSGAWTDGTHTFSAQEATDSSGTGSQAVAAGNLIGTFPVVDGAADDDQCYIVGYKPRGDFSHVRIINTVSGATTGAIAGAFALVQDLRDQGQNFMTDNLPS